MKKLMYVYENGEKRVHTKFISDKTMKQEGGSSKRVEVYECNDNGYEYETGKYITTYMIR